MTNPRRSQISARAFAALLLFCTGLLIPGAVDSNTDLDEQIICGAIVIAEKALLRSEPDSSSAVIKELPFGAPFYSLGDPEERKRSNRRNYPGREPPPWFHVLLPDSATSGWITGREGREAVQVYSGLEGPDFHLLWYTGSERDEFASQRYLVGLRSVHEKDYETAERLFNQVLENQSDAEMWYYLSYYGWAGGNAKTGALIGLAMMYESMKHYRKAIEHYEMIASDRGDSAKARAKAGLKMVEIYNHDLRNRDLALQTAYGIMIGFPGQPIIGPEHYGEADIEAAELVLRMLTEEPASPVELINHGEKMIDIASNPTVKMIGHVLLCEGYRGQRQYQRMKETAIHALLKWPTTLGAGFKNMRNDYSRKALELVVESLTEDLDDYDQALAFCEELLSRTEHPTLHKSLVCAKAQLLDIVGASKETVVSTFEECGSWRVRSLSRILAFQEYKTTVSVERVAAKSRPSRQAQDLFILSKGDRVTVLYGDPEPYDDEKWLKIQLNGNRFGWVEKSALAPE